MYYLGTFFAVRAQAQAFTERWLQNITEGKTDDAFFETVRPPRKIVRAPDDADDKAALRRTLELAFNNAPQSEMGGQRGPFSTFCGLEYVRLLQAAGSKAKIEATGVKDWDYERGGFSMTLTYRVTTDLATFPLQVKVHGMENPSEYKGRQWQVIYEETGIDPQNPAVYTAEGDQLRTQAMTAWAVANSWVEALNRGNFDKVYADTLNVDEKKRAGKLHDRLLLPRLALGPVPMADADGRDFLATRQEVLNGGLVRVDDTVFWAPDPRMRRTVEAEVKAAFDVGKFKPRRLSLQQTVLPTATRDDKRIHLGFELQMVTRQEDQASPPLVIEGRVIVGADLADVSGATVLPESWRVEALELVRGRNQAAPPGPPGGPGGPRLPPRP
jgi:hypothetical protein